MSKQSMSGPLTRSQVKSGFRKLSLGRTSNQNAGKSPNKMKKLLPILLEENNDESSGTDAEQSIESGSHEPSTTIGSPVVAVPATLRPSIANLHLSPEFSAINVNTIQNSEKTSTPKKSSFVTKPKRTIFVNKPMLVRLSQEVKEMSIEEAHVNTQKEKTLDRTLSTDSDADVQQYFDKLPDEDEGPINNEMQQNREILQPVLSEASTISNSGAEEIDELLFSEQSAEEVQNNGPKASTSVEAESSSSSKWPKFDINVNVMLTVEVVNGNKKMKPIVVRVKVPESPKSKRPKLDENEN